MERQKGCVSPHFDRSPSRNSASLHSSFLLTTSPAHSVDKEILFSNPSHPDAVYNLGNLYRDQGSIEDAVQLYSRFLEVPTSTQGQVLCILALAREPLGCDPKVFYKMLEADLGDDETIPALPVRLQTKLEALRGEALHVTNNFVVLLAQIRDGGLARGVRKITKQHAKFGGAVRRIHSAASVVSRSLACGSQGSDQRISRKLHLVVQYYVPNDLARQREIDACLGRNLVNQHFALVHVMVEDEESASLVASRFQVGQRVRSSCSSQLIWRQ